MGCFPDSGRLAHSEVGSLSKRSKPTDERTEVVRAEEAVLTTPIAILSSPVLAIYRDGEQARATGEPCEGRLQCLPQRRARLLTALEG
jgi:hypothetical protein